MAGVDDKVVSISFESSKFEQGVNKTIAALDKLKQSLNFPAAGKALDAISTAAKKVDMSRIGKEVDNVKHSLDALRLVAISVMGQLAAQATRAAGRFIKAFTLDPVKAGFQEYSTNLNAVQTILANTQAAGTKLKDVNAALKELNIYSDKTIYNFSQMAKNIGTFTAAGVDLKTSTASIKGIANLAALSGSNADQASTAMYQLSQAISAGSVKLQDWNSVVNAGMGGTVFQRALAQTAEAMGTLKKGAVELEGPMKNVKINGEAFRNSLSVPGKSSWLTSKVLTATLQQFTSDLSDAELAAMGFNKAQIASIQQTARTAMHAATEVKTIAQVFDVAKETAGSGWAQTFQIIFGDFGEAKKTFTALSNTINGFINDNANARNKVLADWKALGGRTVFIDAIRIAFHNLGLAIKPIKEAFRDVFPAVTGKNLYDLTVQFKNFAEALKPSETTMDGLKRTFRGLFAALDIGKQIITGIVTMFGKMFGAIGKGSGGVLKITGSLGDFVYALDKSLKKSGAINNFFVGLGAILSKPIELLSKMANAIGDLFSGFSAGGFSSQISSVTGALSPFQKILQRVGETWDAFNESLKNSDVARTALEKLLSIISNMGGAIGEAASHMNFEVILAAIRTGLFGAIVLMAKNFFGKGSLLDQISKGFAGGIMKNISGAFGALEGSMKALQTNIKAKTLKEIAIAIALLTASVVAISFVDPKKLNSSIAAIALMAGELLGAMAILDKIGKTGSFARLPVMAAGLIGIAGAIDVLTIAVFALSRLSWGDLAKGLGGVGALLGGLVLAVKPLTASSKGMITTGIGLSAIAISLNIMALAVRQFGSMDLAALGKGLGSVATGLGIMAGAMKVMPKGIVQQSLALVALGVGLKIMASAVGSFAGISWMGIVKGMVGIGGALGIIALAMRAMPKGMIKQAAGLILVSSALGKIASAIEQMGGMSLKSIAKGLGTLAASLIILGVAMVAMQEGLAGAGALATAAFGISLLSKALERMGAMSWTSMIKSLVMLAAALTIIGVAGVALTGAAPGLLAFGAALLLIGAGLALAGAGIWLISTGLSALVVALPTGVGVIVAALVALQRGIIENAKLIALAILSVVQAIANVAPKFVDAAIKIVKALLDGITKAAPMIVPAVTAIINMLINILQQNQGKIIAAGIGLLMALLRGISNAIPQIVAMVAQIIIRFITALASQYPKIIAAGVQALTNFIKGILSAIGQVPTAVIQIITRLVSTITTNLGKLLTAGAQLLTKLLEGFGKNVSSIIKAGTDAVVKIAEAIGNAGPRLVRAGVHGATKFVNSLADEIPKLAKNVLSAVTKLINGMATAIDNEAPKLRHAGWRLGWAIMDAMSMGLLQKAAGVYSALKSIGDKVIGVAQKIFKWHSPSQIFLDLGSDIMIGMALGINKMAPSAYDAAAETSMGVINKFNDVFQTHSPSKVMQEIGQFVGQGFAQGLRGSKDDIASAFSDLNSKLTDAMSTARETIASEQKKLNELRDAKKPDTKAIAETQKVIEQNQSILARSTAAHKVLTTTLKDEKAELIGLSNDYVALSARLDAAEQKLIEKKKLRDDAIKGWQDQYATLPDIVTKDAEGNAVDALGTYMDALKNQADAVGAYQSTLAQLRKLGLDDKTYQRLLTEGTADQDFANQLLAGGRTAVQGLNTLDAQLTKEADKLAKQGGKNLYQAGVDSATGLVKGLKSQEKKLVESIQVLAKEIVDALKKELLIKSPSGVFAELGKFTMLGFAKGISDSTKVVANSLTGAAQDALSQMKSTMGNISEAVSAHLDVNPVITPILDLTQVRAQAGELGSLTSVTPITAAASYGQASIISASQVAAQSADEATTIGGTHVTFEQNNYSPESLTEIEIYRQTKNQLSLLKSSLALT